MKPKTSTMTSAPTGIDDSKEYYFMSSDLTNEVDLERLNARTSKFADLKVGDDAITRSVISIEIDGDGYVLCLVDQDAMSRFTPMIFGGQVFTLSMYGIHFNCHVLKVEHDRCYLRAAR